MKKEHVKPILIIFSIAIIARILSQLCVYQPLADKYNWQHFPGQFNMHSDDRYDEIARNLLAGKGYVSPLGVLEHTISKEEKVYPNLRRPPVYPLILAVQFYLFGDGYWINMLINITYQSVVCIIIYNLSLLIFSGHNNKKKIAIISSLIWALYPQPMLAAMAPITEAVYQLFFVCFGYFFYRFYKFKKTLDIVYASIFMLLMTLTRPISIFYPVYFLIITMLLRGFSFNSKIKQIVIMFLIVGVGVSPWMFRAYTITGKIVPLVTYDTTYVNKEIDGELEGVVSRKGYIRKVVDELKNPFVFMKDFISRLGKFWYFGHTPIVTMVNALMQFPLLLLSFIGFWWARKQKIIIFPIIGTICYFWLAYGATHVTARYSYPMIVLLSPFVAIGIMNFMRTMFKIDVGL